MKVPAPDATQRPKFLPELSVVEVIYSDDKHARVAITKDRQNLYRIHPERWDLSDLTILGHGYWSQWGHHASFTDDIEIARQMAHETLRNIPPSTVIPDDEA
jgi:hypothetical protein